MWINSVYKYNCFKNIKENISKRTLRLIRENLDLMVLYKLLPLNIRENENYLFEIINSYKNIKFNLEFPIEHIVDFRLPINTKKLYKFYKSYDFYDILYINKRIQDIDINLIPYRKTSKPQDFIFSLDYIRNKQINKKLHFTPANKIKALDLYNFKIKKNSYLCEVISSSEQIYKWSIYLNNCLDQYMKEKKMAIYDMKTSSYHKLSYKVCLKYNIISLIALYKNDKPYCLVELVDKKPFIRQILKFKNKELDLVEQHNILTIIEREMGINLEWVPKHGENNGNVEKNYLPPIDTI